MRIKGIVLREWMLYILVASVTLLCVDVRGVVQSVKLRRINDLLTGINTDQLYEFSTGKLPGSAVDWQRLRNYFELITAYFPDQQDAQLFRGYCEYYGFGEEDKAYEHIRRSAENMPYFFWNLYDTGILLFKKGDYEHAISFLEFSLLVPSKKMAYAIVNSIIYRQFFKEALSSDIEVRLNHARINTILLLAAAHYYRQDYDMAGLFTMKGLTTPGIKNLEPFYFYAGATAMAQGKDDQALADFEKAIKAGSTNALVYRYAAEILKKQGHRDRAGQIEDMGRSYRQPNDPDQFPYPRRLRLEFY